MLHRMIEQKILASFLVLPLLLAGCMGEPVANLAATPPVTAPNGNRAPTISGSPPVMARVGVTYSFTPAASDPDADTLTFSASNLPGWIDFDTTTGTLSGFPFLGTEGTYNDIAIIVSDGSLSQALGPFAITVEAQSTPNMPPELSGVPPTSVTVGNAYSFIPAASDPDGNALVFDSSNAPAWTIFNPADGQLSGTPQPGDEGEYDGISISVTDGFASSSLPAFSIMVEAQTSAPVISGTPLQEAIVGELYLFLPTASDPDGDALVFAIENMPGWADFNASTGRLRGTPEATDIGNYPGIVITATDGQETAVLPAFGIDVTDAPNTAPIISGIPATGITAGGQYEFQPAASDADGDTLTFIVQNAPGWASFDRLNGRLTGAPQVSDIGTYPNITITVSDGQDIASLPAFSVSVSAGANTAPAISGTPPSSVSVGQSYDFQPAASDADGDTLTFIIQNAPGWASFDQSNGRLTGSPQIGDIGAYPNITITVSDGQNSASLSAFSVNVSAGANAAPTISGTPPSSVSVGQPYDFQPAATDADGDTLTFTIDNMPGWASIDSSSGRLTGTPQIGDVGSYQNVVLTVSDGQATAVLPAFSIDVNQIGLGSITLSWTPPTHNTDGTALTDLAGYVLHYGLSAGNLNQSAPIDNPGLSTYTIENLSPGTYYFVITAINANDVASDNSNVATRTLN